MDPFKPHYLHVGFLKNYPWAKPIIYLEMQYLHLATKILNKSSKQQYLQMRGLTNDNTHIIDWI
jgi:hypothetical protein